MNEHLHILWEKRPLIISGPCSAETENQVLETARRLKRIGKMICFVQDLETQNQTGHV